MDGSLGPQRLSSGSVNCLLRSEINDSAWNSCVAASAQRIVYGYSWYLDAVLPVPDWKWVGLVLPDETGGYRAVMPVPLRRKFVAGITYDWVVHQPFFCQMLGVFSSDASLDTRPFFRFIHERFRYGSTLSTRQWPDESLRFDSIRPRTTHVLNISNGYTSLYRQYTRDRKVNLRRSAAFNWTLIESTDLEPLLRLFRDNHARGINGGVGEWAYAILRNLNRALAERGLATLRYALRDGRIEAGVLLVQEGNRMIYLFNAASEIGRRGNARTLLIDRLIREKAADACADKPLWLDFESPDKLSIAHFYRSFGAQEEVFCTIRWNRLNRLERTILLAKNALKKRQSVTDADA